MGLFLGLDAGTTAAKAAAFDHVGNCVAADQQEYSLATPRSGWVELPPETYWQACCRAIRNLLAALPGGSPPIQTLCIASQGETLIFLDADGEPVRPAIVWLDHRATAEAQALAQQFPPDEVYQVTGQPEVTPTWPASKILWLRRQEPEAFARTEHILLLEDYLIYRLTGALCTSRCLQTSSLLLDIRSGDWWAPMLAAVGVDPTRFGELVDSGQVVGRVSAEASQATGLSRGTRVVSGGMDQALGAIGAGNIATGTISETTGGALAIAATVDRPRYDPLGRVPCHVHAVPGKYCLLPWGQTAGMALRWFRDAFFALEMEVARQANMDAYDLMGRMAERVPPGSDGLVFLPHLEGAACPEFDPAATGVFFGLTLRHTRAHLVRAIMEAVAYMLRRNLEIVSELVTVGEIRSLGGGAQSGLWLQIKADVLQKPIAPTQGNQAACLGAAILAAVAVGGHRSQADAVGQMVRLGQPLRPNPAAQAPYDRGYRYYVALYEALAPLYARAAADASPSNK